MAGNLSGRVALILEYDGTNYGGWQIQTNADTIQYRLEAALCSLFQTEITIRGASRTDSGVHARGQVASFDLPRTFSGDLASALNWHLPGDIRVVGAQHVPADFNPQSWAKGKIYNYYIFNRPQPSGLGPGYYWHLPKRLDLSVMEKAAQYCQGRQDYACFQASGSQVQDTVRTIRHLFCRRRGNLVTITCCGDGFLYNMVRIIVGTLVEVGLGRLTPSQVKAAVAARTRTAAGPTAPAKGLVLERVLYRPSLDSLSRL